MIHTCRSGKLVRIGFSGVLDHHHHPRVLLFSFFERVVVIDLQSCVTFEVDSNQQTVLAGFGPTIVTLAAWKRNWLFRICCAYSTVIVSFKEGDAHRLNL